MGEAHQKQFDFKESEIIGVNLCRHKTNSNVTVDQILASAIISKKYWGSPNFQSIQYVPMFAGDWNKFVHEFFPNWHIVEYLYSLYAIDQARSI